MKNLPKSPLLLPIKTKLEITSKNITIDNIVLYPTDNASKLYDIVDSYFKGKNNEVINYGDDFAFYLKGTSPLSENIVQDSFFKIEKFSKIISLGLNHGQTIYVGGSIMLKSEEPKNCITFEFEKHFNSFVKYLSCETCKLKCKLLFLNLKFRDM